MKKTLIVLAIFAAVVLVLGFSGLAWAQTPQPADSRPGMPPRDGAARNWTAMHPGGGAAWMGMGGGLGMMGAGFNMGVLHDYMFPAMAAALGLTPEELAARHQAGQHFADIAADLGLTPEETQARMLAARSQALSQAVADGVISPGEADRFLTRMEAMYAAGFGPGGWHCPGTGGPGSWGDNN